MAVARASAAASAKSIVAASVKVAATNELQHSKGSAGGLPGCKGTPSGEETKWLEDGIAVASLTASSRCGDPA